jgi:hypothetical protein
MDPQVKCEFRAWKPEEVIRIAQEQQAQRIAAAAQSQTTAMVKVASGS